MPEKLSGSKNAKAPSIYIVDDETLLADGIGKYLERKFNVKVFYNPADALMAIKANPPDLVLLDLNMPAMSGLDLLKRIKKAQLPVLAIMFTAHDDAKSVVEAMKAGATDYIVKPVRMDILEITIEKALDEARLVREVQALQKQVLEENLPLFVGESDAICEVMDLVKAVAKSPDTPILIRGETGTGKELIARAIHFHSPNFKGPLVEVNCAAIPSELVESELFGYVKGAFSGAAGTGKKGFIEEAADGTLFLDEIGDMNLDAQTKLLRFLDSGEFYRVGSSKKMRVKTRIVSATNKDLPSMIKKGLFREDLYYRIGVITVTAPSLNQRRSDIVPIAKKFLAEFSGKFNKNFSGISPKAQKNLMERDWKGNIRELRNIIERAVLIESGPVLELSGLLPLFEAGPALHSNSKGLEIPSSGLDMVAKLAEIEAAYIKKALEMASGNQADAARLLGIKYTTFRYRMERLG
ncbi:MAG: sigma-54 dependent transcriptional regulator [Desulfatibacillaceae bacterium]|nr:sigma-54 dependent transcriptional regulator [Desulfatibacillaceae bacterium]